MLAAPLLGCEDYGRVTQTAVDSSYSRGEMVAAAEKGITVTVHGLAPGIGHDRLLAQMVDVLNRITALETPGFTGQSRAGQQGLYKVVAVFNPETQVLDAELCAGASLRSHLLTDEIVVRAAFCRGPKPLTGAWGTMEAQAAEDPKRWDRFLQDVGFALFPRQRQD